MTLANYVSFFLSIYNFFMIKLLQSFSCHLNKYYVKVQSSQLLFTNHLVRNYSVINVNFAFEINKSTVTFGSVYNCVYYLLLSLNLFVFFFIFSPLCVAEVQNVGSSPSSSSVCLHDMCRNSCSCTFFFTFTSTSISAFTFLYSHSGMRGLCGILCVHQYFTTFWLYTMSKQYLSHGTRMTGFQDLRFYCYKYNKNKKDFNTNTMD